MITLTMNKNLWLLPATACALFSLYTVFPILREGPMGLVSAVTHSLWSVQVALDLVFAASLALMFAAPEARKYNINVVPWVIATAMIGSIALFAFTARIFYARSRA